LTEKAVYDSVFSLFQIETNTNKKKILQALLLNIDTKLKVTCYNALRNIFMDSVYYSNTVYRLWRVRKNSFESDLEICATYLVD
jgi:hypothetical protein